MVTMIDIDDFLPEVLQYAPNTSDLVAHKHIVAASRKLCDRCKIWRESDSFDITTPAAQGLLTIDNAEIVNIESARLSGTGLEPVTVAWLDEKHPGWDSDTTTGTARYVTQLNWNTVSVYPRQTGEMTARFILKPKLNADELPEFLLREFSEEIGRGAAGAVLTLPTDTANPQLGLTHTMWFEQQLNRLAVKILKGQQGGRMRTIGRFF